MFYRILTIKYKSNTHFCLFYSWTKSYDNVTFMYFSKQYIIFKNLFLLSKYKFFNLKKYPEKLSII